MEPIAISWLIASSSSPLVAVLALWTIYVLHTYRRRWRTVDLFLLAVTSQELVTSVFTFCYALISLVNPPFRAPCSFTRWGLVATRTFQVATLASMVVDRALTVRWPYRYRFSVRRNQIRYHVTVLALVSALVGVAAVFATAPGDRGCRLHPAQWDARFSVFLLCLYGALMLAALACTVQVEVHRSRHGGAAKLAVELPDCASPDLPSAGGGGGGMSSPLDTHSSTGSTRALHRPSRQASRRPYGRHAKGTSDLRWPSVALTALVCFSLNHIPHLVLTALAAWSPGLWSPWHEAVLCWLGLLEGLLVPLLLFCRDAALRAALRRTFQRRSGALSPLVGDDGPFQMYFDKEHFRKRGGTFGPVTPIGIITNYRRAPGGRRKGGAKYALPPGGDSVLGLGGHRPLSKLSCADLTSLEMWREEDEENFYATLSDDFSNFSCKSADDSALSEDMRGGCEEELYGGSFTTLANDDFEFHDTRPCGGEVRMKPALVSPVQEVALIARNVSFRDSIIKKEDKTESISKERERDLFQLSSKHADDEIQKDPKLFVEPPPQWPFLCDTAKNSVSSPSVEDVRETPPREQSNMSRHQKATSYSMNDLDLIHRGLPPGAEFETTFVLPVKSESTMSLYRLNVERDLDRMAMSPSKSETNVNGDSGFGSGAQSTHPLWSGFLCRKPLDPFWNIRKPAAATPTRNYPGILHPRMRKIPWISAWKKLDENSDRQIRDSQLKDDEDDPLGWVDNVVYAAEVQRTPGGEEQQQVGSPPLFGGDYNLNIFAKESGVLLENAYGKIVRDDCGVKVNFYGDNVQYDAKESIYGNKTARDNIFESSFESDMQNEDRKCDVFDFGKDSNKTENIYEPLNCIRNNYVGAVQSNNVHRTHVTELFEHAPNANAFKCEPRLNGGHYENLFGTKENIFAQCDLYKDKSKIETEVQSKLERRSSGRRDSGRFRSPNNALHYPEPDCGYGRLKKLEHRESFNRSKELNRKESDNRGKKCGIKRKESRNRSDKKSEIPRLKELSPNSRIPLFENKTKVLDENSNRNKIEIELKSVYGKNDLNCNKVGKVENRDYCNLNKRESFNNRQHRDTSCEDSKLEHRSEPNRQAEKEKRIKLDRKESQSRERKHSVEGKEGLELQDNLWKINVGYSGHGRSGGGVERRDSDRRAHVERRDSGRKQNWNVERRDSGRQESSRRDAPRNPVARRESQNRNGEAKNEGLWVNAIPFPSHKQEEEDPKRESRKESYDLRRSPRKGNLTRRESRSRNDKPAGHVKRKVSGSRERRESRTDDVDNRRRDQDSSRNDRNLDDFLRYREKCEDNLSHIQNVNREVSADREVARMDQVIAYGKLNGNVDGEDRLPFGIFQEHVANQPLEKSGYDVNDNCRQKKLAITDFL